MANNVWVVVQFSLGLVFLRAGVGKLSNIDAFLNAARGYRILPERFLFAAGTLLVASEIAIGIAHLFAWKLQVMAPYAIVLLISFIVPVSTALKRRTDVPCLCFGGKSDEAVSSRTIVRLILVVAAEFGVWKHTLTADAVNMMSLPAREVLLALLTAGVGLLTISYTLTLADIGLKRLQLRG